MGTAIRSALVVASVVLAACAPSDSTAEEFRQAGAEAAAEGRWIDAFRSYRSASELDPDDGDVRVALVAAADELVERVPLDLEAEVELLRWFAETGRWDELAATVDRSMMPVPAGAALMGDEGGGVDERPEREVYLDAFRIDRYEVTNAQYLRYVDAALGRAPVHWVEGRPPGGTEDHPVVGVSWPDADGYCAWVGKRLPSEAEWERSCRGSDERTYPWGDEWDPTLANVTAWPMPDRDDAWPILAAGPPGGARPFTEAVGSRVAGASPHGVCDLVGNASEWLRDWYDPRAYEVLPTDNPVGTDPPWNHAVRGIAWLYPHDAPELIPGVSRCAFRNRAHVYDDPRIGFRCASPG